MKKTILISLILTVALAFSCSEDSDEAGENGSSHNSGKNCMSCHSNFKLAGSVYNKNLTTAFSGAKITIKSQANGAGTVLTSLTSDKSGNFYTSSAVNFGTGVFAGIEGTTGTIKYMNTAITSGACNSCHGSSIPKVWAE